MSDRDQHVYTDKPDARQGDGAVVPSRFRPVYRALTQDEKELHDRIKAEAESLENLFAMLPAEQGRYRSLALTALEESIMWAVKGLTA